MKPIRIFRHVDCEGPGYLLDVLARHGLTYELVRVDQGEAVPPRIDDVAGLVFMGGGMSANDELPWINQELALIRRAIEAEVPVLGHCLGGQLMSKALGGEVVANPVREIGWLEVQAADTALAAEWLPVRNGSFEAFHWHGERFSIPEGGRLILSSEHCREQAFVIGNSLAMQCHVEMTEALVREWVARFADQLDDGAPTVQSKDLILQGLRERIRHLQAVADVIYARWLRPILAQQR